MSRNRNQARGGRRGSPSLHSVPEPAIPPIVLIADDDETTRLVLQRALTDSGCLALPVDDGGEIWPILEREDVRVLVLDLNMPGVNGWEVLRRLRDDLAFREKHVHVVVLSGQTDAESRSFALQLGAVQFLAKPLDLEVVRRTVLPLLS